MNQNLWEKQIEIAHMVRDESRIAVKAGHSVGKTHLAACIVIWFLCCFENSIIITTAPSTHQVNNLIWKEIRKLALKATVALPKGLMPKKSEWYVGADWKAYGLCTDKGERFRGEHAEHLLILMDEANGVPSFAHEEAANMATAPGNKIVMWGNPVAPVGEFYQAFNRDDAIWKTLTISSMQHPNVVHRRQIIPGAVSWQWVNERVHKLCNRIEEKEKKPLDFQWPFESGKWWHPRSIFLSRVLGEFPEEGPDSLFSLSDINHAVETQLPIDITSTVDIGVDCARLGGDSSVIIARRGPSVLNRDKWDSRDTTFLSGRIVNMIRGFTEQGIPVGSVIVDAIGIGGPICDNLARQKDEGAFQCERVIAFQVSEKASDVIHFDSKRSEIAFALAARIKSGQLDLTRLSEEAKDDITLQLSQIKFGYTTGKAQQMIESKEKYRENNNQTSPDDFDALCLSFVDTIDTFAEDYVATMCV